MTQMQTLVDLPRIEPPVAPPGETPVPPAPDRPARASVRRRIAGLDGLRAVAVTAVVAYHLGLDPVPGGFLGVDVFFVISGFLITTLLLGELERSGRIGFADFYRRRARRLLPALVLMLAGTLVLVAVLARDVAGQTVRDVPGALLYVSNWWALSQEQSYFTLIGRGNMLGHLWSLAVEEQFYLVWPVLLAGIAAVARRRRTPLRRTVLRFAAAGAVASTVAMAWLSVRHGMPIDQDPTRVYFGTDTHAMSVLVGAALAAVWDVRAFRARVAPGARAVLVGVGALGLAVLAWLVLHVSEYTPWLYRGGFLLVALVVAVVIAASTHPASPLGPALDNPPMRWIGERSYGIYLWHWPIMLVTRPGIDVPWTGPWVQAARIGLVLAVAAASYRFVEVPIRQGALARWWAARRALGRERGALAAWTPATRGGWSAAGAVVVAIGLTAALLVTAPTADQVARAAALGTTEDVVDEGSAGGSVPADPADPALGTIATSDVAWYGDSVSLWALDVLREELPGVRIDAGINRSPAFIMNRVSADRAKGRLRPVVVMHLGNAGPVPAKALEATLASLDDRELVVLVNSTARFPFVRQGNATLAQAAASHPNVRLVDWRAISAEHPTWFKDGLHLTKAGKPQFAAAVREVLQDPDR